MTYESILEIVGNQNVAVDHVNEYFKVVKNGRPLYPGSMFERFENDSNLTRPNEITSDDLLSLSFLSIKVKPHAIQGIRGELAQVLTELLAEIPQTLRFEDLSDEEFDKYLGPKSPAQEIWNLLRNKDKPWNVGQTTASKIMARKRPHLIPIYDYVVAQAVGLDGSLHQWDWWHQAFTNKKKPVLKEQLEEIRTSSGQHHLSLLRVLDIILWMHGRNASQTRSEEVVGDDD